MGIFALLINPKTGEPFYAEKRQKRTVTIHALDDTESVGEGYFNEDIDDDYGTSSRITGLPRVHTPAGVNDRGTGLGTVLYTALCAAAHREFEGDLQLSGIDVSGDGVSSNEERSETASAWWRRARERYGLVELVEGESRKKFDESLSARDYFPDVASIIASYNGIEDASDVEIKYYSLSAEGTYRNSEGGTADAYPYPNAERANLVIGFNKPTGFIEWSTIKNTNIEIVSAKALAAVNMGILREYADEKAAGRVASQLIALAQYVGLPAHVIEGMRLRYVLGADVSPATWAHPDFEVYSPVRSNPRKKSGKRLPRGKTQMLVPRTVPRARVGFYRPKRGARSNPSGASPAIQAEVQRLHELRVQLGWSVFAADPVTLAGTKARRK